MQSSTHNIKTIPLSVEEAIASWPTTGKLIEQALNHTDHYKLQDVLREIRDEQMVLWVVGEGEELYAALTTKLISYPQGDEMLIAQIGGHNMSHWGEAVMEVMEKHAKENDCVKLVSQGRKGTEKAYPQYGFEFDSVIMKKVI